MELFFVMTVQKPIPGTNGWKTHSVSATVQKRPDHTMQDVFNFAYQYTCEKAKVKTPQVIFYTVMPNN